MTTKVRVYQIKEALEKDGNTLVGMGNLAILVLEDAAILIEDDACHYIKDLPETLKLGIAKKEEGKIKIFSESYVYPTVNWLINNVEYKEVELEEWIQYFNIKDRVISNCRELRSSINDIGLSSKDYMPNLK